MEETKVETRNVSMYPHQWAKVDRLSKQIAQLVGGRENTSAAMRRIVDEYEEPQICPTPAAIEEV